LAAEAAVKANSTASSELTPFASGRQPAYRLNAARPANSEVPFIFSSILRN
jgi:hypothetical protein